MGEIISIIDVENLDICMGKKGFPGGSEGKDPACNAGDLGLIPGLDRYPFQYSCLENSMDRGGWWVTVHGVAKS